MSEDHAVNSRSAPADARFASMASVTSSGAILRRPVGIAVGGIAVLILVGFVTAVLLRFVQLDAYVLGDGEANWAYDAWSLFKGRPLPGTEQLPETAPFFLIVESLMFFLFGVTDAIARVGPALFGIGIIGLIFALRPFVSRFTLAGMVTLAAISPTLVYASRTVEPAIAVAFSSLLLVVAMLRAANAGSSGSRGGWLALAGFGTAAMLASGPEGITAFIAIVIGFVAASASDPRDEGAARASLGLLTHSNRNLAIYLVAFGLSLVVLFTRLFSDIDAIAGILTTFADWGRMMASRATPLPQSFFFYAILLYEIFAVVFAIVAVLGRPDRDRGERRRLSPALFGIWFLVALLLHSFASGRETNQAVLVALPLVLLGGMGLGRVLEQVDWARFWTTRTGLLPLALLGLLVGVIALIMVVARSNDPGVTSRMGWSPWFQALFVIVIVVLPMAYLLWSNANGRFGLRDLGNSVLLVLALLLAIFTFRSTTALSFYRADDGTELLARNVPTQGVRSFVDQVYRLSRDLSVEKMTNVDNTGSYGLDVAIGPEVEWPFLWYFRDFQDAHVTGPAGWTDQDDIVVAMTPEGMDTAGFVVQQRAFKTRTPNAYFDLNAGTILGDIFTPDEWYSSLRYLLFREMESKQAPSTISVGYAFRVSNQINPNLGPFDLFTRNTPGPGSGLGQLSSPSGIAVSSDGQMIYVVDAGNRRIERYTRDGSFVGVWDATSDPGLGLTFENGQGASALTIGDDGLFYLADTWDHIVIVLDQEGRVVRQLGQRGVLTDIGDGGDPASDPGLFFGPRGVAVLNDEIYVTDTGNERVQVFSKDGTFLRAFGGFGTGTGQLQEPTGIAAGPDGNIYVADSGNGRLVVFSPRGEVVKEIPVEAWAGQIGTDRVNYLAFGDQGILYMTVPSQGLLQAYDGEQVVTVENADVTRPVGVAVAPDGMVLVTDGAESRVVQVAPKLPSGFGPQASPSASPAVSPVASPAG